MAFGREFRYPIPVIVGAQNSQFPPSPPGTALDYNLYNAAFDAAWELDVFGGTRRAVEAAGAEIGVAEAGQRGVLISLLAEVARNYIESRGYQQRLVITRQNIGVQKDALDLTRSRYRSGLASDLDVAAGGGAAGGDRVASALAGNRVRGGGSPPFRPARTTAGHLNGRNVCRETHPPHAAGRARWLAVRVVAAPTGHSAR